MKKEIAIATQENGVGMRERKAPLLTPSPSTIKPIEFQRGNQSWWAGLTDKQRQLISSTAIVLGISVVALVVLHFGVKKARKVIAKNEEGKSFGKDQSATWAKQLKNAFVNNGWWGTNESLVRTTLIEIPSQEDFNKVKNAYGRLYKGESLIKTMTDELKDTEYNEMLAIITAKPKKARDAKNGEPLYDPKGWAIRINAAVNYEWLGFGWGTDEEAIRVVFQEIPTQKAFMETAILYKKKFGTEMVSDLKGDLDYITYTAYHAIISSKPKE